MIEKLVINLKAAADEKKAFAYAVEAKAIMKEREVKIKTIKTLEKKHKDM